MVEKVRGTKRNRNKRRERQDQKGCVDIPD